MTGEVPVLWMTSDVDAVCGRQMGRRGDGWRSSSLWKALPKRSRPWVSQIFPFSIAFLALRCASSVPVESTPVKQMEQRTPISAEAGTSSPVESGKLVLKLPRGKAIGTIQSGRSCTVRGPLTWKSGGEGVEDFGDILREELSAAGYTVVGDPNTLFEDPHGWKAEYVIGGVIKDVTANVCYWNLAAGPFSRAKGEASLAVDWQIYSHRSKAVELATTTEGTAHLLRAQEGAVAEVISQAFLSAFRNLLANVRFHELIAGSGQKESRLQPALQPISITYETSRSAAATSVESMVADARMGVVTVFVGDAMGSGFVISPDGYVLTNQHVIGKARYVKVRFVTGREVYGEVVRMDRPRDVALVKLETDIYPYLPLGESSRVQPGSEVFAIGTPLSEKLGQTVTRGIVSGYGEEEGQRTLRSDVSVHRGNSGGPLLERSGAVVGMSVSGLLLMPEGVGVGLNQFIPIEEALKALGIHQSERR